MASPRLAEASAVAWSARMRVACVRRVAAAGKRAANCGAAAAGEARMRSLRVSRSVVAARKASRGGRLARGPRR